MIYIKTMSQESINDTPVEVSSFEDCNAAINNIMSNDNVTIVGKRSDYFKNRALMKDSFKQHDTTYVVSSMYEKYKAISIDNNNVIQFYNPVSTCLVSEYHEIIRPHTPTRFFMDLEGYSDKEFLFERFDEIIKYFVSAIDIEYQNINKRKQIENPQTNKTDYLVFDASREENGKFKTSYHVIMPNAYFKTINSIGKYVEKIFENNGIFRENYAKYIDIQVYTAGRLFRIPFTTKKGNSDTLLNLKSTKITTTDHNRNILDKTKDYHNFDSNMFLNLFIQYYKKEVTDPKKGNIINLLTANYMSSYVPKKYPIDEKPMTVTQKIKVKKVPIRKEAPINEDKNQNVNFKSKIIDFNTSQVNKIINFLNVLPSKYYDDYGEWIKVLFGLGEIYHFYMSVLQKNPKKKNTKTKKNLELLINGAINFSKKSSKFNSEEDVMKYLKLYNPEKSGYEYIMKLARETLGVYKGEAKVELNERKKVTLNKIKEKYEDMCVSDVKPYLLQDFIDDHSGKSTISDELWEDINKVIFVANDKFIVKIADANYKLYPYIYVTLSIHQLLDMMSVFHHLEVRETKESTTETIRDARYLLCQNIINKYHGCVFDPSECRLIVNKDNKTYVNTYVPIPHKIVPVEDITIDEDLRVINKFIEEQICSKGYKPGYLERYNYLLNWLAYVLQTRQRTGIMLLLCGHKGSGKSLMNALIANLVTDKYVSTLNSTSDMFSNFNGYRHEKLLVVIDEHKLETKYMNDFKNIVSRNETAEINKKFGTKGKCKVSDNYVGACNSIENVNLEFGDRRHAIFECGKKIDNVYGKQIYDLINKTEFLSKFYSLLMKRDISKFKTDKLPYSELRTGSVISKLNSFQTFLLTNFKDIEKRDFIPKKLYLEQFNSYLISNSRQQNFKRCSPRDFTKYMQSLEFKETRTRKLIKGKITYCYTKPKDLKATLSRLLNIPNLQYYINTLNENEEGLTEKDIELEDEEKNKNVISDDQIDDKRNIIEKILNKELSNVKEEPLSINEELETLDEEDKKIISQLLKLEIQKLKEKKQNSSKGIVQKKNIEIKQEPSKAPEQPEVKVKPKIKITFPIIEENEENKEMMKEIEKILEEGPPIIQEKPIIQENPIIQKEEPKQFEMFGDTFAFTIDDGYGPGETFTGDSICLDD
jgi:hypothetical protein